MRSTSSLLRREDEDSLAELVEAGLGIFAGVLRSPSYATRIRAPLAPGLWCGACSACGTGWGCRPAGCEPAGGAHAGLRAGRRVASCGRAALAQCREAARLLPELIEEE